MQKKEEDLDFLFKKISVKLNKSPDDFEPFNKILRANWYDTQDSLIGLTDEDYQKMKIPHRVVTAIREQLASNSPTSDKPNERKPESQKMPVGQNEEGKIILNELTMKGLIIHLQKGLQKKYQGKTSEIKPILEILSKIISNIIKDPYQIKFRTLKKSNQKINKFIIQNQPCMKFLTTLGFKNLGDVLQMTVVEVHHLLFIEDCFDQILGVNREHEKQQQKQQKQERRFLNVTQFPKNEKQINQEFSQEKLSEMKYVDALDKLIQFRNKLMAEPPKDRRIRIYHKKHEKKNVKIQEVNFSQEFSKTDDQIIAGYWKQAMANNAKAQKFQSKRKLEFQFLINQKVHRETLIKIKMPNEYIIEGYFGPLQTLQTVFEVISKIVIGDLYLFTAPPPKRMSAKEMKMNLIELESVPMGSFYLGINTQYYIDQKYVSIIQK